MSFAVQFVEKMIKKQFDQIKRFNYCYYRNTNTNFKNLRKNENVFFNCGYHGIVFRSNFM